MAEIGDQPVGNIGGGMRQPGQSAARFEPWLGQAVTADQEIARGRSSPANSPLSAARPSAASPRVPET